MKFAHTILMTSQALTFAASQVAGRFLYSFGDTRVVVDVTETSKVGLSFSVSGHPYFTDGLYPLRHTSNHTYRIDFGDSAGGVSPWYQRLKELDPEGKFDPDDLQGFEVYPGFFVGVLTQSPDIAVNAAIGKGAMSIIVVCGSNHSDEFTFSFVREERPYLSFGLSSKGGDSMEHFHQNVEQHCPELYLMEGDFSRITFATPDLVILPLQGFRFPVKRVSDDGPTVVPFPKRALLPSF
ncbi:hypothetical protein FOZ60_000035 [Perkinsus olseni]|uniref:Uncharacterized protein n=1 Tax=Perkinsus olseni TaxID=32597 RepID=A0A7J6PNK6_PEROL|nr:hypothetical protein FOZ60_000035 [Perkinsus olseni]